MDEKVKNGVMWREAVMAEAAPRPALKRMAITMTSRER
jgi:hypothetical protein